MRVNIIGAGLAGLSAGCYLQMKGFDTVIFESHQKAGGLCTSWKRGGYTFDGCIHWLLGSTNGNPFYKLWSELIDMDSVQFVTHETRFDIELKNTKDLNGSPVFHLFTDLVKQEKYMHSIAPEDNKIISRFINSVRKLQKFEMPPSIEEVPSLLPLKKKIRYIKHLPMLYYLYNWRNITNFTYANRFKNPFLKEAFQQLFDGLEMPLLIMSIPMSYFDKKSAGYPIGGSSVIINKIEEKYLSLGGKIRFGAEVERIITDRNSAVGVKLKNGEQHISDITVSAADWHSTIFQALEGKYVNKTILKLEKEEILPVFYSAFMLFLGINKRFDVQPHMIRFPIPADLISPDGTTYERMELHTYNYDPTMAPKGKTVLAVTLYTKKSSYWIDLRKDNPENYNKQKSYLANQIIDILEDKLGGIRSNIEEMDMATPATFYRYTNNWKGSIQGWLPGKKIFNMPPVDFELPGLKNFYYCGHWSVPGGGLPVALKSARDVVKIICSRNRTVF